ncbi:MAG: glycosyltransferase family 2 protein [Sphingomonas sp.]|uniref:glycosyltransferase family 2 protein n=1 Tax=Sphingomonas sp. TaxID=28214 RepID=UPI0026320EE4|nr:glycosyltransferase family A protein [Sphingomonas sp.]MDK2768087.1 glycosyltransferase family 2 protein [Sphingomonas sp.]
MQPLVTISTITANRRRFFPHTIRNVLTQLGQGFEIEWIIVEDGEETVEDLVSHLDFVRYVRLPGKHGVAHKRNVANDMSLGQFVLYFDDDNFAFPHRTIVSVNELARSNLAMAGSSDMLILDRRNWEIFQVGPYSDMHATLGTWCVRREIFERTRFEDTDLVGEEVAFTRNWSIPILQLGALNTSISFSHGENTVPKGDLKEAWTPSWVPETFIGCAETLAFYRSVPGRTADAGQD